MRIGISLLLAGGLFAQPRDVTVELPGGSFVFSGIQTSATSPVTHQRAPYFVAELTNTTGTTWRRVKLRVSLTCAAGQIDFNVYLNDV